MKASKAVGIASSVLIIIGLAMMVVPLFSLDGISVQLPSTFTPTSMTSFSVPVTVSNRGPLPLDGLSLGVNVYEGNGTMIGAGGSVPTNVGAGSSTPINVNVLLVESLLVSQGKYLLTQSQNLTANVTASMDLLNIMPVSTSTSISIPWGAPMSGLAIGEPSVLSISEGQMKMGIPVSFHDESSFIPVQGKLMVSLYNGSESIGGGYLNMDVMPGGSLSGKQAIVTVNDKGIGSWLFENATIGYTLSYAFNGVQSQIYSSTYTWHAPMANLALGAPSVSPINSSYVNVTIPVTFQDYSQLSMSFNLSASAIINGSLVRSGPLNVTPTLGQNSVHFSFILPATSQPPGSLNLTISTSSLALTKTLRVSGA